MTPLACRYSIIQFTPFAETGEFANIGIVLACPKTGYFSFLIERKKYRRITSFFRGIERSHYVAAVDSTVDELNFVLNFINDKNHVSIDPEKVRHFMTSLTRPREAIIKYSPERVVMCADPEGMLKKLFAHYVEHDFATREYVEERINSHIKSILDELRLSTPFKQARLGSDAISTQFKFVQIADDKPIKLIKALNLSHKDPIEIGDHGDTWVSRMKRLERANPSAMPKKRLFTVELPPTEDAVRWKESLAVIDNLQEIGIQIVDTASPTADEDISRFALAS
ncbi:hypothetical protein AS359_04340 [Comamonas kerstersii]|uniref:DUF3037 domain-containing protein n=1 Tax=Comamonas kerstersii TaxID=225992 RepID=A0A0W7YS75_9BURK|nr:DUF3037 domain-containing protein [Comamonas kerstersii]KUF37945.1 hypothetical protein AS359_04340 [Comamonas kerstersii]DAG25660.1 MAG TPA: Protein of unknown function (DUF3037) [Caudoviricetes sp.]